jgi:multiple sugar transport system substrate-binding protein
MIFTHKRFSLSAFTGMCLLTCLLIVACSPGVVNSTPVLSATPPQATMTPTKTPHQSHNGSQSITIWVPPLLAAGTPAGSLLDEHLTAFEDKYPLVELQIRVKEENGPSGILETLSSASLVAPSTLPEIVLLDPTDLNAAALKNLIDPFDGIIPTPNTPDWYPFAIEAAYVDSIFYGLPFLSEAEAFAYRKEAFEVEPKDWADLLDSAEPILFPLGDQNSKFTLIQYISSGGKLVDDTGNRTVNTAVLADLLAFYLSIKETGQLPLYALQLQSAQDTWYALTEGNSNAAVIPVEVLLDALAGTSFSVAPWPTQDGTGVTPTRTLTWALVSKDGGHSDAVSQILQWLIEPAFLGKISQTLGMIPVTQDALQEWSDAEASATLSLLIQAAVAEPDLEEVATFGSPLWNAVEDVLNERVTPETAAENVSNQITSP